MRSSIQHRPSVTVALLLAGVWVGGAWSATQRPLGLGELVQRADEIVVARVVATESRWQDRLIVTAATVEVEESLKGAVAGRIEITQLGGTATHPETGLAITMTASTQIALAPGEDVLLFVRRTPTGLRHLVGAQQGKYVIREGPTPGEKQLPIGPKRLVVLRGDRAQTIRAESMTLEAMRERIRSYARGRTGGVGGRE